MRDRGEICYVIAVVILVATVFLFPEWWVEFLGE